MTYAIIDCDGYYVTTGYPDINTAIAKAKQYLLIEADTMGDCYKYIINRENSPEGPEIEVASVTLELDWTIKKVKL